VYKNNIQYYNVGDLYILYLFVLAGTEEGIAPRSLTEAPAYHVRTRNFNIQVQLNYSLYF